MMGTSVSTPVFYYTDVNTATAILARGNLWASNIAAMNDASEYTFGLEVMRSILPPRRGAADDEDTRQAQLIHEALGDLRLHMAPWYILCFSGDRDALNQWEFYAREGGVCLGLEFPKDVQFAACPSGDLAASPAYVPLNTVGPPKPVLYLEEDVLLDKDPLAVRQNIIDAGFAISRDDAIFLKRHEFERENELRLAFRVDEMTERCLVHERTRFGVCVPYLDIHLPTGKPLPITSVTVGPGRGQRRVYTSLRDFLDRLTKNQTQECTPHRYAERWKECIEEWSHLARLRQARTVDPKAKAHLGRFIDACQDKAAQIQEAAAKPLARLGGKNDLHDSVVHRMLSLLVRKFPDQVDIVNSGFTTRHGIVIWRSRVPYLFAARNQA